MINANFAISFDLYYLNSAHTTARFCYDASVAYPIELFESTNEKVSDPAEGDPGYEAPPSILSLTREVSGLLGLDQRFHRRTFAANGFASDCRHVAQ